MRSKNQMFIIIVIFISIIIAGLNIYDYFSTIKVKSYLAEVTLNDAGDMVVEETLTMKYPDGYHVIYRDIIYDKGPSTISTDKAFLDEESVDVKVYDSDKKILSLASSVKCIDGDYWVGYSFNDDRDERGVYITCPPEIRAETSECESIFVYVKEGMQREMTFKFTYTITGAVTVYNDVAQLNWKLIEYFDNSVKDGKVNITLPANAFPVDEYYLFGHGLYSGVIDKITENDKMSMTFDMKSKDFLEFRLLTPVGLFPNAKEANIVNATKKDSILAEELEMAKEADKLRMFSLIHFYSFIAMVLLMAYIFYYVYNKYDKELKASFDGEYYRELPATYSPAEMSYLYYFKQINDEDVTATVLDLIRRKVLVLDTTGEGITAKKPNFKLILNKDKEEVLREHERIILKWFINEIGDGNEVSLKQIETYPKKNYAQAANFKKLATDFKNAAKKEGKTHNFFDEEIERQKGSARIYGGIPILWIVINFFLTSSVNLEFNKVFLIISIAIVIIFNLYIATIKRRSASGNEDFVKWKAYKNFLLDFSNMKDYPMPGVIVWEHYIVYATSLKIADQVMKQLEVKLPPDQIAASSSSTFLSYGYGYHGFRMGTALNNITRSISTARTNSISTIAAHNASRGGGGRFGGGGGFSGGSSFGGGGGGFRSR